MSGLTIQNSTSANDLSRGEDFSINQRPTDRSTIGVIVVNYNYANYVSEAIESVLAQEPPFHAVVVVDDGSTDDSRAIIEQYKHRVQVLSKENGGQLSACLAGLQVLTTDYVYILDADDYVLPDFTRTVQSHLSDLPEKVQFQLRGVDSNRTPVGFGFPTYPHAYGDLQMRHDNQVIGFYVSPPTSGNVYRRAVLEKLELGLIDSHEPIDGSPALAIPYLGVVKSVNALVACYRVHGSGHSRWDQPDLELLEFEISWFHRRWRDVCHLLNLERPPFGDATPLYLLERALMRAALRSRPIIVVEVYRYIRRLLRTHLRVTHKLILTAWALALVVPMIGWRRALVRGRRSPLNRPAKLECAARMVIRWCKVVMMSCRSSSGEVSGVE